MLASVHDLHARYRRAAAGEYLVIGFDMPFDVVTVGGSVDVLEIVIGWNDQYANALFTIDAEGRIVAHEKYSGAIAIKIREALAETPDSD